MKTFKPEIVIDIILIKVICLIFLTGGLYIGKLHSEATIKENCTTKLEVVVDGNHYFCTQKLRK